MDRNHTGLDNPAMQRGQSLKCRAIIDAATEVFCEQGLAATSIDSIANRACVSRQTVYNQFGDKEKVFAAVVNDVTQRSSAKLFATLGTFPDKPADLEDELIGFGVRLVGRCMLDATGAALRKLIDTEGQRHPQLFQAWKDYGPGKSWPSLAAGLAKLAHEGYLQLDDANLAARQFMALLNADLPNTYHMGVPPTEAELRLAATNAVRTFLRAFGKPVNT